MVFSSLPAYLDPANWQQQPSHHQPGSINGNPQLQPSSQQQQTSSGLPPPPLVHPQMGSIRPGSMAERARLANIPMPETSLKCPRCESSNTKFCYFNNYSLTQPRHFCKTCRRYWTRGGALRNVPVGGGCRRNKRTKSSNTTSSKSPASSGDRQTTSSSTSNTTVSSNNGGSPHIPSLLGLTSPQIPPLRFLSPLSGLSDQYSAGDIGLNYGSLSAPPVGTTSEMNFPVVPNFLGGGGMASLLSGGAGIEQWRLPPQFPFLGGLEPSSGLFQQVQTSMELPSGFGGETGQQLVRPPKLPASMLSQLASVKMEDHNSQELNLSRQLLGMNNNANSIMAAGNNDQHWSGASASAAANWTDLTSFSSSNSTTAPL